MAYAPIAFIIPQYEDYPNYWLKAYEEGTVTPLSMATDADAGTTLAKSEIDTQGFPTTAASARFIPFIDGDYDLWLFPTEAEADANDTTNAIQFADNLNTFAGGIERSLVVADKATAAALVLTSSDAGKKIFIISDDGGEFTVRFNAAPGTYADDGGAYTGTQFIPSGGDGTVGIVRDFDDAINARWFGVKMDGATDDTATAQTVIDLSSSNNITAQFNSGTLLHTGLTIPFGAKMIGDGEENSILMNTHATNDSVSVPYPGSSVFNTNWQVEGFTIDTQNVRSASQAGLRVNTCRHGVARNLTIQNHYYNVREQSSWSNEFSNLHLSTGEYMWYIESGTSTGGTPNYRENINGDGNIYGIDIENNGISSTVWIGGSIEGTINWPLRILGNTDRTIAFININFETNNNATDGYDVILGDDADAVSAVSNIEFSLCQFTDNDGGATRIAFDLNRGSGVSIDNCNFINYLHVADISPNFGSFSYKNLKGLTKFSDTTDANTTYPAGGFAYGTLDSLFYVGTDGAPVIIQSSSNEDILSSRRHTESYDRFEISAGGLVGWHAFNQAAADVTLGRGGVGVLEVGAAHVLKTGRDVTASRPLAATAEQGSMFYDTTLSKPIWSDGTVWRDAAGTAV